MAKRFKVICGVLCEHNSLLDSWEKVDIEKVCTMLNKFNSLTFEFLEDMKK